MAIACESLAILFASEDVETKEITVKLLKIMTHTFGSTTYSEAIRCMQLYHPIILMASKMAETDQGPLKVIGTSPGTPMHSLQSESLNVSDWEELGKLRLKIYFPNLRDKLNISQSLSWH